MRSGGPTHLNPAHALNRKVARHGGLLLGLVQGVERDDAPLQDQLFHIQIRRARPCRDCTWQQEASVPRKAENSKQHARVSPVRQPPRAMSQKLGPLATASLPLRLQRAAVDSGKAGAADIQALQRLVGNRAVSHLVQPILAPETRRGKRATTHEGARQVQRASGAIRRVGGSTPMTVIQRTLDADDIVDALKNIKFIAKKLSAPRFVGQPAEGSMEDHVRAALGKYQDLFSAGENPDINQALMLTLAIDGVLQVIAEELYDPWIQPLLAQKLWELYGDKIKTELTKKGMSGAHWQRAFQIATAMTPGNPIAQYMHREEKKEACAEKIRQMAAAAHMTPGEMFALLNKQFQADMAAYTKDQINRTEDKREAYNIRETPGQLSVRYYKELFGDVAAPPLSAAGTSLVFGGVDAAGRTAQDRLDALQHAVTHPPAAGGAVITPADVRQGLATVNQERHLRKIEAKEDPASLVTARNQLKQKYRQMVPTLTDPQAQTLVGDIEAWLNAAPLTITVQGKDWFGRTGWFGALKPPRPTKGETKFRPATAWRQSTAYSKVFDKRGAKGKIEHLGKFKHPSKEVSEERGEQYLRFRKWKDYLMTSRLGLSPSEMPAFGAVNVQWKKTKASEFGDPEKFGKNYYGDTHFKLRKANVQGRLVYTATDHGRPRRNPLLALRDFALGGETYTRLKDQHPNTKMLSMVASAAKNLDNEFASNLPFEVQIFGTVDIARDIQRIYLAPAVSKVVKQNVAAFCPLTAGSGTPVDYRLLAKPPAALVNMSGTIINTVKAQLPGVL
jgi:hypothetical protein